MPLINEPPRLTAAERSRRRRHRERMESLGCAGLIVVVVIVAVVAIFGASALYRGTERTVTVHVTDKERVCGHDDCKYLVYTDHGTFAVKDSHWPGVFWRTNSSDVYGRITRDRNYRIKVIGWRSGLFSHYPNIERLEPVTET